MQNVLEKRSCLDCGSAVKGRVDKKFCNNDCRNNFNNRNKHYDITNLMRNVNNALRNNRKVMKDLLENINGDAKITVHKDRLQKLGFNFKYITHTYTTLKNHIYHFCYDYGYMPLENDRYLIVKRNED